MIKQPTAIICLSPYAGGMELDAISFAKKLNPFMETILIVKENHFMHEKLQNNTLTYETINFYKTFSFSIILNTRKIIKKYDIKNVIFFGASELKSLYFAFLGLDINFIIRHSTTKSSPKKDWFHKLIYSNVDYHISTSKHLEKNVHYIIPFGKKSKARMIYSSLTFNEPKHIIHDIFTIVHTGRIADAKGQTDAIKACQILVDNNIDFKFFIVGGYDEDYKEEFLEFYNSITYQEKITLVGFTNNVSEYLHKSDLFIFPSYGEGLSLSFREALSNNMLCMSYNNTSFPELKDLGLDFYLVDNLDINALKNDLLKIALTFKEKNYTNNYSIMKDIFSEEKELNNYFEILR